MSLRKCHLFTLFVLSAFFVFFPSRAWGQTAEGEQPAEGVQQAVEDEQQTDAKQRTIDGGRQRRGDRGQSASSSVPLEERKIRFNFRNQMWKDVIEYLAEQADLSVWAKTYPQGTFTYKEDQGISPDEAIDKLNQYLLLEEFVLIRMDKMLIVRDLGPGGSNGIQPHLVQTIFPEELAKRGSFEVVKCQFALKRTTPDIVQVEIDRILGPQSSVAIMPQSQTILITETVSNLRAIQKIIERLENTDESGTLKFYELKSITAEEAVAMMRNLMGLVPEDQTLRVVADVGGKKIWLSGRSDRIEKAIEILTKIDDSYVGVRENFGELQFKAFPVDTADLMTVLAVCQTLLAGKSGIRLQPDPGTNSLLAYAYLDDLMVIKNTLASMQADASGNHVIRLSKMTTSNAATAIEKFFGTGSGSSAKTPIVEPDATNKCLYVRCTSSQLAQIRSLLATMGETFDAAAPVREPGKTIRNINISPSAAELILDQIQQVWPQGHENPIKVVTPSAIVPAMRPNEAAPRHPVLPKDLIDQQIDELFHDSGENDSIPNPSTQVLAVPGEYRTVQMTRIVEEGELTAQQQAALERFQREMQSKPGQPEGLSPDALAYLQGVNPNKGAPVVLSIGPSGLMLASEDTEALDALEELIETMSNEAILTTPVLKLYYLKYISADSASTMLNRLMGTSSSSTSKDSVFEDFGTATLFNVSGSLGPIQATGDVTITADTRTSLNAIFVKANPVDHYTIDKKLLPLLDVGESPEDVKRLSTPRMIPLKYMKAKDAMEQVKIVFAQQMQGQTTGTNIRGGQSGFSSQAQPPGGGAAPQTAGIDPNMMQQILQRMQGGGRGGTGSREEEEKMTLNVVEGSNILVVNAPEVLFERVKRFVESLDEAAGELDIVTEFVDVKNVNPQMLQSMVSKVVGSDMITSSGTVSQPRGATTSLTSGSTIQTGIGGATGGRTFGSGYSGTGGGFSGPPPFGGLMSLFGGQRPSGMSGMGSGPTIITSPGGTGTTGATQPRSFSTPGSTTSRGGR